ncbi:hypothetical protein JS756_10805 [Streptomyces actuosus]|uniref:VanZ-like domain-containing protein n=1 Tax=Streptomyces actuosus TaxID=1885 RepID=A0ABS2VN92_STRAS|nr:hypothetical protein [Streptomyces actuosus]MBN0044590.1 hypothetical protein [Streptomyces actuosus]
MKPGRRRSIQRPSSGCSSSAVYQKRQDCGMSRRCSGQGCSVHLLLTGTGSVVVFFGLLHAAGPGLRHAALEMPRWVLATVIGLCGTGAAVLWEMYEWVAEQAAPGSMRVGYGDTIADLAVGAAGSLAVGGLFAALSRGEMAERRRAPARPARRRVP